MFINKVSHLFEHLTRYQMKGHLQEFEFNDQAWDILYDKTEKQIRFINALIMKDNWFKLREVFKEWGIPKSQEYLNKNNYESQNES